MPGGAAVVLHTLPARLGPPAPIPERDARSLAGTVAAGTAATRRVISFLHAHTLLEADELSETPAQLLTDVQHQAPPRITDLSQERRDRHDEKVLHTRIAQLPAPMAERLGAGAARLRPLPARPGRLPAHPSLPAHRLARAGRPTGALSAALRVRGSDGASRPGPPQAAPARCLWPCWPDQSRVVRSWTRCCGRAWVLEPDMHPDRAAPAQ